MDIGSFMGSDAAGSIGGALVSGIFGALGQKSQNQFNAQQGWQSFLYQTALQNAQQAYNTNMSNTQYQRGVADMKQAGLNPMLMAGGFTPASASASQGSAPDAGEMGSPLSAGLSSALQGSKVIGDLKKLFGEADKATSEAGIASNRLTQEKMKTRAMEKNGIDPRIYEPADSGEKVINRVKDLITSPAAKELGSKALDWATIPAKVAGAFGGTIGKNVRERALAVGAQGKGVYDWFTNQLGKFGSTPAQQNHIGGSLTNREDFGSTGNPAYQKKFRDKYAD